MKSIEAMSDATDQLAATLDKIGAHVTIDHERSTALPCIVCGTTERPRELVTIGTYGEPRPGNIQIGDDIDRPMCEQCYRNTRPRKMRPCQECPDGKPILVPRACEQQLADDPTMLGDVICLDCVGYTTADAIAESRASWRESRTPKKP